MSLKNGIVSFVLSTLFLGLPYAQALDLSKFKPQAIEPSVQLILGEARCSGTMIYSGRDQKSGKVKTYILTAQHCTKESANRIVTVSIPVYDKSSRVVSKQDYNAIVEAQSYKSDLAMLKLQDEDTFFPVTAQVADKDFVPQMGEEVATVGYSLGLSRTVTTGVFGDRFSANFPDENRDTEYFRATPAIAPGNSGGSLFGLTDEGYKIIGVSDVVFKGNPQLGLYVPVDQIQEFLSYVDNIVWPVAKETGKKND